MARKRANQCLPRKTLHHVDPNHTTDTQRSCSVSSQRPNADTQSPNPSSASVQTPRTQSPGNATPTRNPRTESPASVPHADTQPSDSFSCQRSHADTQSWNSLLLPIPHPSITLPSASRSFHQTSPWANSLCPTVRTNSKRNSAKCLSIATDASESLWHCPSTNPPTGESTAMPHMPNSPSHQPALRDPGEPPRSAHALPSHPRRPPP